MDVDRLRRQIDIGRAVAMLLVHDLVEIDAGDAFLYDLDARAAKQESERAAADRIYAILPDDQRELLRGLWDEYDAHETPEARFATAVDRLLPMLLNHATQGSTWREYGITPEQVLGVNLPVIAVGSEVLASFARELVADSAERRFFGTDDPIRTSP
jgi:putative hydrolases of HD superfamily